ncbi:AbrB/MazE/SpoVT family DNA-binding domain-containing protein [Gelria sp. Kuro-4]|uniref:AbrB/MazE/SpoVT family DNA-binding domain-containing protein n=1 Tax=Gelria sp. Kuro-4 TaxID=2796927 RepID=UPI001BEED1AA|nr:AbrB/MazE/SpoVT family DNA-binding domain-containing protein [Gelria sp. Kuro-4]BCV24838.1 hypothetical protein kuro4_16110 [Gelria sp. Kuro-4]
MWGDDMPSIARVSPKGWVVIPKELRKHYGLAAGSKVMFVEQEGALLLLPVPRDPIATGRGILKGHDLTSDLLFNRATEREAEELEIESK